MRRAVFVLLAVLVAACGGDDGGSLQGLIDQEDDDDAEVVSEAGLAWDDVAPTLTDRLDPSSSNPCNRGDAECVDLVIAEMKRRVAPLAAACDHDALFAVTYLHTTEAVALLSSDVFDDPAFISHMDAIFASIYFDQFDAWHRGDRDEVSPPWQAAFEAADTKRVRGIGDLVLAMNAHVTHDLALVLERIGAGAEHRPDYERVNALLADSSEAVTRDMATRFDPEIAAADLEALGLPAADLGGLFAAWRSVSWTEGMALAAVGNDDRPAAIAAYGVRVGTGSLTMAATTAYLPLLESSAVRDEFCAANA